MYTYLQLLLLSKMISVTDWRWELTYTDAVDVVYGNDDDDDDNNNNNNNSYKIRGTVKLPNVTDVLSFTQEKAADLYIICRIPLRTRQRPGEYIDCVTNTSLHHCMTYFPPGAIY
jgi:hypothetical protein